jgi:hypothetical protein
MTQSCEHHLCLLSFWGSLGVPLSLSPSLSSLPPHLMPDDSVSLDDAEWEVIADGWWYTPLSLVPCPLSWIDREPRRSRPRHRSEVAARSSHRWHESLLLITKNVQGASVCCRSCQEWRYKGGGGVLTCDAMKESGVQGDVDLNSDLVGVKMVLTMVNQLESAVGFATTDHHVAAREIAILARRVSLLLGDAPPVVDLEGSWDKYTATVLDGHRIAPRSAAIFRPDLNADPPPADSITSILDLDLDPPRRKSPRFSREVIDLTDSEQSVASIAPPATPKPAHSFPSIGGDGTASGTLSALCRFSSSDPCTPLPVSISEDLPKFHLPRVPSSPSISYSSSSPLTSDELRSESSHTRCSSLPPGGDLHKEEDDVEVVSESTPSEDADIPLFLVTSSDRLVKQHSRTREIIDRLRSATIPRGRSKTLTTRGNGQVSTPVKNRRAGLNNATVKKLFQKGSDGWICLADDTERTTSRTKDTSQTSHEDSEPSESDEAIFPQPVPKSTRDSTKKQTQDKHWDTRCASGWLEGTQAIATSGGPPRGVHGHRLPQIAQPAAPASVGTFTFPPPAYYAFPNPVAPQYVPIVSFGVPPYRGYPSRGGYAPASPPFISTFSHQHQQAFPPQLYPQPHRAPYANAPVITGSTGIRHAQW